MDGIDYLKDNQTKKQALPAFWLPKNLPIRVRYICTLSDESDLLDYFTRLNCQVMTFSDNQRSVDRNFEVHREKFFDETKP